MIELGNWLPLAATAAIATATLAGLSVWARHVGTRSTPVSGAPRRTTLALQLIPLCAAQIACGWVVLGAAGAVFNVAAGWMMMGWLFVLLLNARPEQTLLLCRWLGGAGVIGCLWICVSIGLTQGG